MLLSFQKHCLPLATGTEANRTWHYDFVSLWHEVFAHMVWDWILLHRHAREPLVPLCTSSQQRTITHPAGQRCRPGWRWGLLCWGWPADCRLQHCTTWRCPPGRSCTHGWSVCWCWSGPAARRQRWRWASRRRSGPAVTSLHAASGSTLCCLERNKEVRERLSFCTETQRQRFRIHLSSNCSQHLFSCSWLLQITGLSSQKVTAKQQSHGSCDGENKRFVQLWRWSDDWRRHQSIIAWYFETSGWSVSSNKISEKIIRLCWRQTSTLTALNAVTYRSYIQSVHDICRGVDWLVSCYTRRENVLYVGLKCCLKAFATLPSKYSHI